MSETATSDTNATELEHDDGRGDPARASEASAGASQDAPANPADQGATERVFLYDDPGSLYDAEPTRTSADVFRCDDPDSVCDDPDCVLGE